VAACANCGAENPAGQKFCGHCGGPLAAVCSSCGSSNPPGQRFCGECGAVLTQPSAERPEASASPGEPPLAERRLVSVLFADLVGFTSLSESRDPEEVRELLSRYFESCRRLIELYGGVAEKFIGDAVMAVWGTPVAQEDDAERAVRAALDLVSAVTALGEEVGAPELRARAGVLTGAAVANLAAVGEGMVAGDLVNTAARIQAAAEPGSVLVGESTRRASERAVAFEEVGEHALKGKDEPVALYRALRVTASRGGALRSEGLEAPFVGRERELRLVKELFHGSADEQRAQLALVTGIAGIGKSRLAWEFEKYVDGLAMEAFWHRGRCLSYGEGVAYWALAEMVRMRCRILEDEDPETARAKLRLALEEYVLDVDERAWVEPRLAHLLGLEEGAPGDQENLFSAWRILFERLAEQSPTILVFEDLHWADAGLLDFLEYLLDWSRGHPLFVLALARPEFADKRPSWGAGKRSFSSLYLEPLSRTAMGGLLGGLIPGLPDDLRERILDRAEGVPLYAVETVRMLLDRGLLTREGDVYRATGAVGDLEVPETLHALVAARLDSLTPEERRLVESAAVLGKTFTKQGLAAVRGVAEAELEPLLASLLGKEILSVQADPRSPERGQYAFLQDIVKRVAYETIAKRERKAKHLAAAQFLASAWSAEEDEIVEVVASHYLDAYQAAPDDPDAPELRSKAFEMLVRAAERAASLGASAEAQRTFERAAGLTEDRLAQAELYERAGMMASMGARQDAAAANLERARELFEAAGATHPAARVSARVAEISWERGRIEQGLESMDRAFAVLSEEDPDADLAALAAQIGRFMYFAGQSDLALERLDRALEIAEMLSLPETIAQALNTKGVVIFSRGRKIEGLALMRKALEVALDHDKPSAALRAYYNLADTAVQVDRAHESAELARDGLALARRVGNRYWEWSFLAFAYPLFALGDWDEVVAREEGLPEEDWAQVRIAFATLLTSIVPVRVHRGQLDEAKRSTRLFAELERSADLQEQAQVRFAEATLLSAEGQYAEALSCAEAALETRHALGSAYEAVKESFVVAVEAALALDEVSRAEELLAVVDALPLGISPQFLQAHSARFRARLAARGGDVEEADRLFRRGAGLFRELGFPFYLAVTLLEQGEWLVAQGRRDEAEPLLVEAREIFERLEAKPWLERLDAVQAGTPTEISA
jgi:class 3 adenylate cyclase/tetratricopeptide (TPR) repeat protein